MFLAAAYQYFPKKKKKNIAIHKCLFFYCTGKILADQFAGFGAKLILSARNVGELERVKDEIVSMYSD